MFVYREGKQDKPAFFVKYSKMNAVKGYLTHYSNFMYLRFIRDNPRSTDAEKRQAVRELVICDRKLTWWQRHPNYDSVAVSEGKRKLHQQWEDEMSKKITVVIMTYQVPFSEMAESITEFDTADAAKEFINQASKAWWKENKGNKSAKQCGHDKYEPIDELGYNDARYELWDGENGFHAIIDKASYWRLHEEHYKREFDDQGLKRPGYLRAAMGEDVTAEREELYAFYAPKN